MKTPRIVTAVFCVVAIVALYGCGGSSQLSESPTALDEFMEAAQVRISASSLGGAVVSSDASKAFFDDDTFLADGDFTGDGLGGSVTMECEFLQPSVIDVDGVGGDDVVDIVMTADVANCAGERNCCVYPLPGRAQPCLIDVACLLDSNGVSATSDGPEDLANTGIQTELIVYQAMTTNMQENSGIIAIVIENMSDPLGPDITTDLSAIAIETNSDFGEPCYTYATQDDDRFRVMDSSTRWDGENAAANDGDILDQLNYAWNVDDVGVVQLSAVDSLAACEIEYSNMYGVVTFIGVSMGASQVNDLIISGKGRICNDRDYGLCEGDAMWPFGDENPPDPFPIP